MFTICIILQFAQQPLKFPYFISKAVNKPSLLSQRNPIAFQIVQIILSTLYHTNLTAASSFASL